ncbi:hypothetical protein NDR87_11635 [Nocardia sp. CDC159]|uniref:Uncharacterized protein n=1 Tax=Nocardia pulmonis TaxID=2951408 RepID=A0A9X2E5E5_9NOCA|nr:MULTISPECIES: hypothetical protein [Nocardia]MCM6774124.1 hypothetical protein [Nocardia pulmonis]MCM6787011.1 hypothetical protein [Nocardia sp. CDC159]
MTLRKLAASGLLCAASLLVAAPLAQADSGSSSLSGPSSLSGQINPACLIARLATLSGVPPTGADCFPPTIPVARVDDGQGELALR